MRSMEADQSAIAIIAALIIYTTLIISANGVNAAKQRTIENC
jgi:hypothetical protein